MIPADDKIICSHCGSPSYRRRLESGETYLVSILDEILKSYFVGRTDVEDLLQDRLCRAERIIVDLRKALGELKQ